MADDRHETKGADAPETIRETIRAALRALLATDGSDVALVGRWSRVMDQTHRPQGA